MYKDNSLQSGDSFASNDGGALILWKVLISPNPTEINEPQLYPKFKSCLKKKQTMLLLEQQHILSK